MLFASMQFLPIINQLGTVVRVGYHHHIFQLMHCESVTTFILPQPCGVIVLLLTQ